MDPANIDWVEAPDDRAMPARFGVLEDFLFQNIRRIVREEVRAALSDAMPRAEREGEGDERYLSINQAAEIARLHHTTIREWIRNGSLQACRAGRVYRIRRADLDARLAPKGEQQAPRSVEDQVTAILASKSARRAA
jgi:excisionase family DNA binding protein